MSRLAPLLFFALGLGCSFGAAPEKLLPYVNTLQGTDSTHALSHGGTLPLVAMPWGMTEWSPQTVPAEDSILKGDSAERWFFQPGSNKIQGFRATHQPSTWIGDYGQFQIMPQSGAIAPAFQPHQRALVYEQASATFKPDDLKIEFKNAGITAELTATERCGLFRFTFQHQDKGRLIIQAAGASSIEVKGRTIRGISRANRGGVTGDFGQYFVIALDRDITLSGTFSGNAIPSGAASLEGRDVGAFAEFKTAGQPDVNVRVGTSLISFDQAEQNLKSETDGSFDTVRERATAAWEKNLGKIGIEATDAQKKTFYTCLYRAQLFPHRLYEVNAAGKPIHYSPYDGKIHDGVLYSDSGIWDTYRTSFPFYTVVFPKQLTEILQGWLEGYKEGGWLPEWPSPGYRSSMVGAHTNSIFADAVAKGIPVDVATIYEAMHKDAFEPPTSNVNGRAGLSNYMKLGFIPEGEKQGEHSVSTTLDYTYDDWCAAQVAKKLGKMDDYKLLMGRAQNYRLLWDPSVGFMRAKNPDGTWVSDFDEFAWGGPYVEGGAWQNTWAVPHDPQGLAALAGGPAALTAKLDRMLTMPPTFHPGAYKRVIHEMQEMANAKFGQYAQSNQPVFHVLYLYAAVGQPWKTEYWTRRVCDELYNSGVDGFPGDEDTGSMSSWYLLSSLGFYPLTPGVPEYVLTSPLFKKAVLHLDGGKTFTISAPSNSVENVYVQSRKLNGKDYTKTWISHAAIIDGGTLDMVMGPKPNERAVPREDLPYSASEDKK